MGYTLVEPPISIMSTLAEVDAWIARLEAMPVDEGVRRSLEDARALRAEIAASDAKATKSAK